MGRTSGMVLALSSIVGGIVLCALIFVVGQRVGARTGPILHGIFLVVLTGLMIYCYSHYRRGNLGARRYLLGLAIFACGAGILLATELLVIYRPLSSLLTAIGLTLEILGASLAIGTYWRGKVRTQ